MDYVRNNRRRNPVLRRQINAAHLRSSCPYRVGVFLRQRYATPIPRLFGRGGPAAIMRLVITVGIDAIYRMQRGWARTHICIENDEIVPPLANGYPARAIIFVVGAIFIAAATAHSPPNLIFRGPSSPDSAAVHSGPLACRFRMAVLAAGRVFTLGGKLTGQACGLVSAVALARPFARLTSIR